jgi:hypothetical protein
LSNSLRAFLRGISELIDSDFFEWYFTRIAEGSYESKRAFVDVVVTVLGHPSGDALVARMSQRFADVFFDVLSLSTETAIRALPTLRQLVDRNDRLKQQHTPFMTRVIEFVEDVPGDDHWNEFVALIETF